MQPAEAARGPAAVELRRRACASRSRPSTTAARPSTARFSGSCGHEIGAPRRAPATVPRPRPAFAQAIDDRPPDGPAYLSLGDISEETGTDLARPSPLWEQLVQAAPDRAYLAFDRLERAYQTARPAGTIRQTCARGSSRDRRRTGGPGWRCRAISQRPTGTATRSSCCSTPFRTTRTGWSCIRPSGKR